LENLKILVIFSVEDIDEVKELTEELETLQNDNDDLEVRFTEYQEIADQRYELLLQENNRLKEENKNLKNVLEYEGFVDIDDMNTDDES